MRVRRNLRPVLPSHRASAGNGHRLRERAGCHQPCARLPPSEVAEYQKACPSLDIRPNGDFVMHDRVHYRRCLPEMKAAGMA
jgi:hypothetical protein